MKHIEPSKMNENADAYLKVLAYECAESTYHSGIKKEVRERIDFELETIQDKGLAKYFLILYDLVRAATYDYKTQVGPCRGSVAGSLVCYCLGITKVNPLEHGLLFERFINPYSYGLSDIGINFEVGMKDVLTAYLKEKYGEACMSDILGDSSPLKIEILECPTLSKMRKILTLIRERKWIEVMIDNTSLDSQATLDGFSHGETKYIDMFQPKEVTRYAMHLNPLEFQDLVALYSMYRPGPMKYMSDYQSRKIRRTAVEYKIPLMKKHLCDTCGLLIYQEQMMQLVREIANFTPGESDGLRRAIAKRKDDKLGVFYEKYLQGGLKNGYTKEVLDEIWNDWYANGIYYFNKSHAVSYTYFAFQMMALKMHFPEEFFEIMNCNEPGEADFSDKNI